MGKEKKNPIPVITHVMIKQEGLFDFDALNAAILNWFKKKKYYSLEKEHSETKRSEGFEIIIDYGGSRKIDSYVKFDVSIKLEILRAEKVYVEGKGSSWRGSFRAIFGAKMHKNYLEKFKKTGFSNFTREIYEKYIINKRLSSMEEKLFKEVHELINEMNDILGRPRVA